MGAFKGLISLGGLYCDGVAQRRPTRPWIIDLAAMQPYPGIDPGNAADFTTAPQMSRWRIGDTPDNADEQLRWAMIEDGPRTLLLCDRVILFRVSWDDLDGEGLVNGRSIAIDRREYRCRLITGGSRFRAGNDGYLGALPTENEWDRFVGGEEPIAGLPRPSATDLDDTLDEIDRLGPHNQIWNWLGANSWTQTPFDGRSTARCCRGYHSANFFYLNTHSHRHEDIGWRPVLELVA